MRGKQKNPYEVLGVDKKATSGQIRKSFHKKARRYHPDKKGGDKDKFAELSQAYAVLINPNKRDHYDKTDNVRPVDEQTQCYHMIMEVFFGVLQKVDYDESSPIISLMDDVFKANVKKSETDLKENRNIIKKMQKIAGRIIRKSKLDADNFLKVSLEVEIEKYKNSLNTAEDYIRVIEKCRDILKTLNRRKVAIQMIEKYSKF